MKQMLHIFAKDSRQFWPEILICLALVAAFVWIYPSSWLTGNSLSVVAGGDFVRILLEQYLGGILKLLIPVSWWMLVARVIHAESLVGDRQFWLTRPYEWKKLLGAKALFLLVFLYLPLLIAQCLLLLRAGFHPLSFIPGLLFNLLLITGIIVLPLMAIASVTATFARLTVTLLAGAGWFHRIHRHLFAFLEHCLHPFRRSPCDPSGLLFLRDDNSAAIRCAQGLGLSSALDFASHRHRSQRIGDTGIYRRFPRLSSRGRRAGSPCPANLAPGYSSPGNHGPDSRQPGPGEHSVASVRGGRWLCAHPRRHAAYRRGGQRLSLDFSLAGSLQPPLSSRHRRIPDQLSDEPRVLRSVEILSGHATFHIRAHAGAGRQCEEYSLV